MQLRTPCGGFIQRGDPGQLQRKSVDGAPGIRARVGGGVAAHHALGVDEAGFSTSCTCLDFLCRSVLVSRIGIQHAPVTVGLVFALKSTTSGVLCRSLRNGLDCSQLKERGTDHLNGVKFVSRFKRGNLRFFPFLHS